MIALVVSLAVAPAAPPDRLARLQRWLLAVVHHKVGTLDDAASEVASWSDPQLGSLLTDLRALTMLMRDMKSTPMSTATRSRASQTLYEQPQLERLRILACAAGGIALTDFYCKRLGASSKLDDELWALERFAIDGRGAGADNFILKYGALLETDAACWRPRSSVRWPVAVGCEVSASR